MNLSSRNKTKYESLRSEKIKGQLFSNNLKSQRLQLKKRLFQKRREKKHFQFSFNQ
jgi:hypothetical protein